MKKYIAIILVLIAIASGVGGVYDFTTDASTFRTMMGLGLILAGLLGVGFRIVKKEQNYLVSLINLALVVCIGLGYIFLTNNYLVGAILLAVSSVLIIANEIYNKNFKLSTILLSVAICVPTVFVVAIAKIYGFNSTLSQILNILYLCLAGVVLAICLDNLLKEKSLSNAFGLSFGIFFYILNFLVVLNKYSNLSRYFAYTITGLFVVAMSLLILTILFEKNKIIEKSQEKASKFSIKSIIAVFLVCLVAFSSFAGVLQSFNFAGPKMTKAQFLKEVGADFDLPIIEINTQNNQLPKTKEDYLNCSFSISNCKDESHNFSVSMKENYDDEGCVGIRLRGNSTKLLKKQPFRIKFDEEQSLLGIEEKNENKSWVLLADYLDASYIKNYTAFTLSQKFDGLDFSPTPNHVALIINNEFKGLYLLCEQIDENSGRTNVKKDILFDAEYQELSAKDKEGAINFDESTDFPFLVEMDRNAHLEGTTGVDNFLVKDFYPVEIKYPENDERCRTKDSDKVYDYINEYINAVFTTLKTGQAVDVSFRSSPVTFTDLVDIDSFVDYYLVNEIMHNSDNAWGSIYMHKTQDGKLKFGPVWDFDWSMSKTFGVEESLSEIECARELTLLKKAKIYKYAMQNEQIYQAVQTRFDNKKQAIIDTVKHLGEYKATISKIAKLDAKMWHGKDSGLEYDYVRLFLMDRYNYLSEVFNLTHQEFISQMQI